MHEFLLSRLCLCSLCRRFKHHYLVHLFLDANTDFMSKQQGNEEVKSMQTQSNAQKLQLYKKSNEDQKRLYYL